MSKTPKKKSSFKGNAVTVGLFGKKYKSPDKAIKAIKRGQKRGVFNDLFTYNGKRPFS